MRDEKNRTTYRCHVGLQEAKFSICNSLLLCFIQQCGKAALSCTYPAANSLHAMTSALLDTKNLETVLQEFADARNWQQFHSPKNLVMALTGEVGELVEIFQWRSEEESWQVAQAPETAEHVRQELADVALYLIRLASVLNVDLNAAIEDKLVINAKKYPPL